MKVLNNFSFFNVDSNPHISTLFRVFFSYPNLLQIETILFSQILIYKKIKTFLNYNQISLRSVKFWREKD
jgi:hypothetical protein